MNQDNAPEADHIIAEDNTQPSDNPGDHTEALDEVRTQTKDEDAPTTEPPPFQRKGRIDGRTYAPNLESRTNQS
ncbi:hypothetical protein N7445_001562 [Penicillium cf. griseofulvum]|nr:hypothetical protein N7445_001562 [Penicillium cf. griseofulvum]